ncbi:MAG: hypothetical protein O7H39_12220 [Gammaproteobacteria bacterium]|nr:hypothetical protein [Gammaproteobacteria bacterium]
MPRLTGGSSSLPTGVSKMPIGIVVNVSHQGLVDPLPSTAMVYVFVREQGQRMPVAVEHFAASELPKTVSLGTSKALTSAEVVARISPKGRVEKSADDIEKVVRGVSLGHPPHTIDIVLGGLGDRVTRTTSEPKKSRAISVPVRVSVDPEVDLPGSTVVFVSAKAPDSPIPVAVRKLRLSDLPTEIELTDADAMMFTHTLSTTSRFVVSARISVTGTPSHSPGDWVSRPRPINANDIPKLIEIEIDDLVP